MAAVPAQLGVGSDYPETKHRPVVLDTNRMRGLGASVVLVYIAVSNAVTWLYFPNYEGWQATWQLVGRYLLLYQQWAMFAVPSSLV